MSEPVAAAVGAAFLAGILAVLYGVYTVARRVGRRERLRPTDRVFVLGASGVAIAAGLNLLRLWSDTPHQHLPQPGKLVWYGVVAIGLGVLGLVFGVVVGRNPKAPQTDEVTDTIDVFG
jgi:H+/Cl- antiporter ClcA